MTRKGGYRKISTDEDKENVSFLSALLFQWMNSVFKIGSERPLDQNDFLPLSHENSASFLTDKLQASWVNKHQYNCEGTGKRPKLWKSLFNMLSVKDAMTIVLGYALNTLYHLLCPLFLGYLVSKLMSAQAEKNLLYGCALALCFSAMMGGLGMHQHNYRCILLGIRISSAVKGLVYRKVSRKMRPAMRSSIV